MAKEDNIMREIKEDVQRERAIEFIHKYGKYILAGIVILILLVSVSIITKKNAQKRNDNYNEQIYKAVELINQEQTEKGVKILEDLFENSKVPTSIRTITGLRLAQVKSSNGNKVKAIAIYKEIYQNEKDLFLKNQAGLAAVNLLVEEQNKELYPEIEKMFFKLIQKNNPLQTLALEQKALFEIQKGEKEKALQTLESILSNPKTDNNTKQRIEKIVKVYKTTL